MLNILFNCSFYVHIKGVFGLINLHSVETEPPILLGNNECYKIMDYRS